VKPALTPEEWGNVSEMSEPGIRQAHRSGLDHRDNEFRCFPWGVAMDAVVPKRNAVGVERFRVTAETPRERHALAALALHGQTFGFSRKDLDTLTALCLDAKRLPLALFNAADDLHNRIAALLPPEEN
jgi:hypothetical protein